MLLQKHKKKSKLSPTDPAFDIRVSTFVAEPLARLSFQRGYVSRRRAYDGYSTVGRPHLNSDVPWLTCAHADCLEKIEDLDLFSALKHVLTQIKQAESLHACPTFRRSKRDNTPRHQARLVVMRLSRWQRVARCRYPMTTAMRLADMMNRPSVSAATISTTAPCLVWKCLLRRVARHQTTMIAPIRKAPAQATMNGVTFGIIHLGISGQT